MPAHLAVVIPTHDRDAFVLEAIRSVGGQDPDVDIVVVDDASTDTTQALLEAEPRITYLRNEVNQERSASRNRGAEATDADWLLFLDDDDVMPAGAMLAYRQAIEDAPEDVVAIVGRMRTFDASSAHAPEPWPGRPWTGSTLADCAYGPFVGPNKTFVRRSAFDAIGGWDSSLQPFEDFSFGIEVSALGRTQLIPELTLEHRVHDSQSDVSDVDAAHSSALARLREHDPTTWQVVARRRAALRPLWTELNAASTSRGAMVAATVRAFRTDPGMARTPLGRRSGGVLAVELLRRAARLPAGLRSTEAP